MNNRLEVGMTRIMHTRSGQSGTDEVVVVTLDHHGALVTWPRALGFVEAFDLNSETFIPDPLIARDGRGWLTLSGGRTKGASASSLAHSEQRIRYRTAVATGAHGRDYAMINGMKTEVQGLARWAKMTAVETRLQFAKDGGVDELTLAAKNLPSHELGGSFALKLMTSYSHQPHPKDGVYTITGRLTVETRTHSRRPWSTHVSQHRMIQDLMCLAYSYPCASVMKAAMRHDDQQFQTPNDPRRWWPEVFEPTFGRGERSEEPLGDREPLFYLDETDPFRVTAWLNGFETWSRPTWIAVTTLFQRNSTVEAQLLQVGVALEALGYAIWCNMDTRSNKTPSYRELLKVVTDSVGVANPAIYGPSRRAGTWRDRFNRAFKGVKHADKTPVSGREAITLAQQGFLLIRCWLALELGVERRLLRERLDAVRTGRRR